MEYEAVRGTEFCQAVQRHGVRNVLFVDWHVSRIEGSLRLPCTPSIKTNTLPFISLLFAENTLSERVRHLSEIRPFNFFIKNLIRSLFSSVSDSICSICFYFSFYSPFGKNLSFLHLSPFFFSKPVSLRFCHYV